MIGSTLQTIGCRGNLCMKDALEGVIFEGKSVEEVSDCYSALCKGKMCYCSSQTNWRSRTYCECWIWCSGLHESRSVTIPRLLPPRFPPRPLPLPFTTPLSALRLSSIRPNRRGSIFTRSFKFYHMCRVSFHKWDCFYKFLAVVSFLLNKAIDLLSTREEAIDML